MHSVHCRCAGQNHALLISVEGTSEESWPPSPPLQEVSHHENGVQPALLSVGMAGKSHWSASFSIEPPHGLFAELACLVKSDQSSHDARFIGSTYEMPDPLRPLLLDDGSVEIQLPNQRVRIEPASGANWDSRLELQGHRLAIVPAAQDQQPRQSIRWGYRIRLIANPA